MGADRPKYGALNLLNHPDGGAPRFGSCHVRLRPIVNDRVTYTFGDSHLGPADIGTSDAFRSVLAALLESATASGTALGIPVKDLAGRLRSLAAAPVGADPSVPASRTLDDYVEAQVHGRIHLTKDAEALVVDPSFRHTAVGALLVSTGVPIEWHAGFVMAAGDVPAEFRVAEMPAFALEVANRLGTHGRIDAVIVGQAALSVVQDPADWAEWGNQDETLQFVKYLWHILVAFGLPA